jgi:hypothetical protein
LSISSSYSNCFNTSSGSASAASSTTGGTAAGLALENLVAIAIALITVAELETARLIRIAFLAASIDHKLFKIFGQEMITPLQHLISKKKG